MVCTGLWAGPCVEGASGTSRGYCISPPGHHLPTPHSSGNGLLCSRWICVSMELGEVSFIVNTITKLNTQCFSRLELLFWNWTFLCNSTYGLSKIHRLFCIPKFFTPRPLLQWYPHDWAGGSSWSCVQALLSSFRETTSHCLVSWSLCSCMYICMGKDWLCLVFLLCL